MSNNKGGPIVFGRSDFTGLPVEYQVPKSAKVVVVGDFFVKEMQGGAELTTEALIEKSPHKVFKLHSQSVTRKILDDNKDKFWIFTNFAGVPTSMLAYLPESGISYVVVEYDFKFCAYRSTYRHEQHTKKPCDCGQQYHGQLIASFFNGAKKIFWMSVAQKEFWLKNVPSVTDKEHVILSSVFDDATLDFLSALRKSRPERDPRWAILGAGSWIKGVQETQKWCEANKKPYAALPNMPYREFLSALNKFQGFIFMPLDKDTCPRVAIEARLLGMNVIFNDNVLHANEPWSAESADSAEAYMRGRGDFFWKEIEPCLAQS